MSSLLMIAHYCSPTIQAEWRQRRQRRQNDESHAVPGDIDAEYADWKARIAPVVAGYCARIAELREEMGSGATSCAH